MASEVESSKSFSFGGVFRKRSFSWEMHLKRGMISVPSQQVWLSIFVTELRRE